MTQKQWEIIEKIIRRENEELSVGLIVDSPWIPGYCGVSITDFFAQPQIWMEAYRKIKEDFPEAIFLPDWWNEYGMASEPSGFGCRIDFYHDNLPAVHHIIQDIDDTDAIEALKIPDPRKNGLMPLLLSQQRYVQPYMREMGEDHYIVSSRGPMTIATHLMGLSEFLVGIKTEEDMMHRLLQKTTTLCKQWLEAQLENVGSAKGILVLDDVCGFLNDEDYRQFALPYLKDIFHSFDGLVHFFHNDTAQDTSYPYMEEIGVDVFNFTHKVDIGAVRRQVGDKIVLLGNVPPMSLARQSQEEVYTMTRQMIDTYKASNNGSHHGLMVSVGGGMPMGATKENTLALIRGAKG